MEGKGEIDGLLDGDISTLKPAKMLAEAALYGSYMPGLTAEPEAHEELRPWRTSVPWDCHRTMLSVVAATLKLSGQDNAGDNSSALSMMAPLEACSEGFTLTGVKVLRMAVSNDWA